MKRSVAIDDALIDVDLPAGEVAPSEVLPALYAIVDAHVARVRTRLLREGRAVSCRAGCAACCRQLVPVAEPEMHHLAAVVKALPAPHQDVVLSRFAAARERLREAGLHEALTNPPRDRDAHERLLRAYFRLDLACPFLGDDEKCTIYADRPAICREYNVTSPALRCARPFTERLDLALPRMQLANVLARALEALWGRKVKIGPMTLLFDHLARAPAEPRSPAPVWFDALLAAYTGEP